MVESDTWEGKKNLGNIKEVMKEFEKKYKRDIKDIRRQKKEKGIFRREELPGRFTAKKLYKQIDKKYNKEYWARLERNWRCQKRRPIRE